MRRAAAVLVCAGGMTAVNVGAVAQAAPPAIASRHTSPQALTLTESDVHSVTGESFRAGRTVVTNAEVAAIEQVSLATIRSPPSHGSCAGFSTTG